MNTISLRLPDSLHKRIQELADHDQVSIDQFVISAIAEKISAFMTKDYLDERAKRASKEKFELAMAKVPEVEPEEDDRI
ncbi:MAG: hypothetical protein DKINENOH_00257 [bacterium]|nr:hypothetical protein [bacterium]NUM79068.1 toxin-antitoxin system HicB family antitoxin [candidate division KSB1 bacterium]